MKDLDLFLKIEGSHRAVIVGHDPGLTVGIAILDLKGNLISLASFKEIRRSEIVSHIINYGRAVLIATDVFPAPKNVKKIASTLNSKIWSPYRSMSVESKIYIVDSYLQNIFTDKKSFNLPQNAHERDALAAAVKTYRDYLKKFQQIEKRAEKADLSYNEIDSVKTMVINGTSISTAIDQIVIDGEIKKNDSNKLNKESKDIITYGNSESERNIQLDEGKLDEKLSNDPNRIINSNLNDNVSISKLNNKLKSQQKYIKNLKLKNALLEDEIIENQSEISKLRSKINKLHREYTKKILQKKELSSKITMIKRLQEQYSNEKAKRIELEKKLESRKDISALELSENAVPVKIIESFTKEGIRDAFDRWKIKRDDVVLLKNSEGGGSQTALMIVQLDVKAVITMDKISDPAENIFKKNLIPLIPASDVKINSMNEFATINSKSLKREIDKWNETVMDQRKTEDEKKLMNLVEEYRAQRRRSSDQ
ncbi:DUF460 domain-containing protein [Methanobacterium spitsbergense]|uniref:DUF460 domain-containing protein n=1 Tax=Methanobacterium spitsbergense TaxID=2874285 RepID=A0A8T5UP85_9EURY|nr:DUF460 domain-containing protein [Methanobacterium spitsbergense]MBZ2165802.1 DUF460 domain-containing protein [Methanobacterium spitsbergense]